VKRFINISLTFLFSFLPFVPGYAQEKGTGPREKTIKMELKSSRQVRFEKREQRRKERAEKKAIKAYHKRLQTKKVRKRMKESRKAAVRYNDNKREFFLKRWFKNRRKRR
jgi:hypothetical protein